MKNSIFILAILLLTSLFTNAQNAEWVNFTNGEYVLAIAEDATHIWAGTTGGLVSIDKLTGNIGHFNKTNSGLPDNYVLSIAIDNNGNKWIGTRQAGLAKFDNVNWTVYYPMGNSLPHDEITSLCFHNSTLWIGTKSSGFASYDGQNWAIYNATTHPGAPFQINGVNSIAMEQNGKLWIGTHSALVGFDGNNWEVFNAQNTTGYPAGSVNSIQIDSQNNKWMVIGQWNDGALAKYDNNQMQFWTTANSSLPDQWVNSLAIDQNGLVWVCSMAGVSTFNGTAFVDHYSISNTGLPVNEVNRVFIDSDNSKWFGAYHYWDGGGLVSYNLNGWQTFNTSSSELPHNLVLSITKASTNDMWIGTQNALSKFDGANWTEFNQQNSGLPAYIVTSIAEDDQGLLWITTQGGGLASFDGVSSWTVYNTSNSQIPDNAAFAVKIDQNGLKWITTSSGLATLDANGNWVIYNTLNGLPDNWTWSIAFDQQNNTWIGTFNGGLAKVDAGGNLTVFNTSNSTIPDNRIFSIVEHNGLIWVGTRNGLASFDGSSFNTYDLSNSGLPENTVHSIAIDLAGHFWLGTLGGLARFDGLTSWTVFDQFNSFLPSNWVREVVIDNHGNKWIGTHDGGLSIYNQGGILSVQENQIDDNSNRISILNTVPNPFVNITTIHYKLEKADKIRIEITNMNGQLVDLILHENLAAGDYKTEWNASRYIGGIYFCTIQGQGFKQTKKIVLLNK